MAGFSIPAAEHSTITAWGCDGEAEAYRNMLRQFAKPGSLVAVVSDSYDLDHAA
jgi:nicotinamide phosphoribosyltransferase